MILCSNAHASPGDRVSTVGRRLVTMVQEGSRPKFTLGIEFEPREDGTIAVHRLIPGGAAERDGLKEGDVLRSANGAALRDPMMPTLTPMLRSGAPIEFALERAGHPMTVTVRPNPRP